MKQASFKFRRYYDFDTRTQIQTQFGTVICCYDDLPPIPEEITNASIIKRFDTYLGRGIKELKNLGVNIKDSSSINKDTISNIITVFDGYELREYRPPHMVEEIPISDRILIGTLRIDRPYISSGEIRGRIILHDPNYDIYFSIPARTQWISRIELDERRMETIRSALNKVFNINKRAINPIITYRYSFGGYIALLKQNESVGNLFFHTYRPSSPSFGTGQTYVVIQKDNVIEYVQLYKVKKDEELFEKILSVLK